MIEISDLLVELMGFKLEVKKLIVGKGEYFVIMGASGTGKTVFLESLAGFLKPKRGSIVVDGYEVTHLPPEKRGIVLVPQDYGLWPHMTVYKNISFPLEVSRVPKNEIERKVLRIAKELGIEQLLDRKPSTLSGGEKQRVALARALVTQPKLVLLDEPTSSLDANTKRKVIELLRSLKGKVTIIHVTHDPYEALKLADKIAVMKRGSLSEAMEPREAIKKELQGHLEEVREFLRLLD